MAQWGEYHDVVWRAQCVIAESREIQRFATEALQSFRERSASEPTPALADRRFEEMNELIENLNKRLESQPVIEQAKGILMARSRCSPDEAFEMLRRASMRMNRKLREVAADIVAATTASEQSKAASR